MTVAVLAALLIQLAPSSSSPVLATHLCGNTGSPAGPFNVQAYEAADWRTTYARTLELAGFNQLLPDVSSFSLPLMENGPRSSGSSDQRAPYIPPTILKAIAWIESGWGQADSSVPDGGVGPALISHDCGYGITQVTSGMQNVSGVPSLDQAMIGGHYAFNIARGARILAEKWNLAPNYRPLVGNRDPHVVENWYYAVWSYNGFGFSNHPINPSFNVLRSPYVCNGTQPRSNYPFQELIFGCVANPPVVGGTRLWDPLPVTLPNLSDPAFTLDSWSACSGSFNCSSMDILTPGVGGMWWMRGIGAVQWGASGDIPVPGDYNGDGTTDRAVWRSSSGTWHVQGVLDNVQWGDSRSGDIPVPGDYNGDGKTDLAVWRPSTGIWWMRGIGGIQWGDFGDIPVPGDYNGDGITDLAVWRPSSGTWHIRGVLDNVQWGDSRSGDIPVPGDYNGDSKTDLAVWRPSSGTWHVRGVLDNVQWGDSGDIPVSGDYNGDGKTDLAVWRPSTGIWWMRSIDGIQWGDSRSGDIPVPGDYDGDGKTDLAVWRSASSSNMDSTTTSGDRTQALGAPVLSVSPTNVNLVTVSGTQSGIVSVTVSNAGTGPLVWRLSPSVTWLGLSRTQGVSLGTDIGPQASTFTFNANALSLAPGIHSGQITVESLYASGALVIINVTLHVPGDVPVPGDYNGDGTTDLAVWRPGPGTWHVRGVFDNVQWGASGDIPVPGDYNGDGTTDLAVWRPSSGTWHVRGVFDNVQWGASGDIPVPGDYDGDGKTDLAVWRPSSGTWHVRSVFDNVTWGVPGDVPVPGDYDGDNKTDMAVWRPSDGVWYVSGTGSPTWGVSGDIPVPGDYNGDNKTDVTVWRSGPGTWHVRDVFDNVQWGTPGDIPVPGDYNGDGITDLAVWRPTTGVWHVRGIAETQWGVGA